MENEILECYRKAGKISKEAKNYGASLIKENVKYLDVVKQIDDFILKKGAKSAFPVNIAINNIAAHFTPKHDDNGVFKKGDVVKLDVGAHVNGYIGDTAKTIEIGTNEHRDMIDASKEALELALELVRPKADLGLIGGAIEQTIKAYGFKPISNLTGHGLKQYTLHSGLSVPNIRDEKSGKIKIGDVLAIEPFATNGVGKVGNGINGNIYRLAKTKNVKKPDAKNLLDLIKNEFRGLPFSERWCFEKNPNNIDTTINYLTKSGFIKPYAVLKELGNGIVTQAEHTVIVTKEGCEVIT